MNAAFLIVTILFMLVSLAMVLIILVQRPSGGGLAGAFGGAGGSGADTVFGGRVGDALTWATVGAFVLYLGFAIALNLLDNVQPAGATTVNNTSTSLDTPLGDVPEVIDFGDTDDFDIPADFPSGDSSDDEPDETTDDETSDDSTTEDSPDGEN